MRVGATTVLYALPRSSAATLSLIAFPGDAVAFPGWPCLHGARGCHPHAGGLLGALFGRLERMGTAQATALFVVEPEALSDHHAVFSQFLPPTTASGEPVQGYDGRRRIASMQLAGVLDAVRRAAAHAQIPPLPVAIPLIVAGFSKGGVVANQILAELALASDVQCLDAVRKDQRLWEEETVGHALDPNGDGTAVLSRLAEVHFLDVGLHCRGAYLTDMVVAAALGARSSPPRLFFHGTPRQWRDPTRRWLVDEKDRSVQILREGGLSVIEREYFVMEQPSLEMHFRVCEEFETSGSSLLDRLDNRDASRS